MNNPTEAGHQFLLHTNGRAQRLFAESVPFDSLARIDLCSERGDWSIKLGLYCEYGRVYLSGVPLSSVLTCLEEAGSLVYTDDRRSVQFFSRSRQGISLSRRQEQKMIGLQGAEVHSASQVELPLQLACHRIDAIQSMDRNQQLFVLQLGTFEESLDVRFELRVLSGDLIESLCQLGVFVNVMNVGASCCADTIVRPDGGVNLRALT